MANGPSNLPTHFPTPPKSQNHQAWSVGVGQPRTNAQAVASATLDHVSSLATRHCHAGRCFRDSRPRAAARDSPLTRRQALRPVGTLTSPASPRCRSGGSAPRHRASPRRRAASRLRCPLCLDSEVINSNPFSFPFVGSIKCYFQLQNKCHLVWTTCIFYLSRSEHFVLFIKKKLPWAYPAPNSWVRHWPWDGHPQPELCVITMITLSDCETTYDIEWVKAWSSRMG